MLFKDELKEYKGGKQEARILWARIDLALSNKINELAEECNVYPAVVVRYILDKSLDKMNADVEFRNYILEKTIAAREDCGGFVVRKYLIRKDVNDKLMNANKVYRINNLSAFLCESVKIFFKERNI